MLNKNDKINKKLQKLLKKADGEIMHCTTLMLMVRVANDKNGGLEILKKYIEMVENSN